ncbi:T9SS type A sorting domain-containing protein [Bacteroidota bacterium]
MRIIFVVVFLFSSTIAFTQDYSLFHRNSKKLFTTYPTPSETYDLVFDTAMVLNNDSLFYPLLTLNIVDKYSDSCFFWGGPYCKTMNKTGWAGGVISTNNMGVYHFFNSMGDTLYFNMVDCSGDTSLIYTDNQQSFYSYCHKSDTIHIINLIDSAWYFRIIHLDTSGNPINSALHNQEIIVGKDLGLIRFFLVDSFPLGLQPIQLLGNISPTAGITSITNEDVYQYEVFDEIQYHVKKSKYNLIYIDNYRKIRVLQKTVTVDSIIYHVEESLFQIYSTNPITTWYDLKYKRDEIVTQIPFNQFDGTHRQLYMGTYCGLKFWTYKVFDPNDNMYCAFDTCWGPADVGGFPYKITGVFVLGLGNYLDLWEPIILGPDAITTKTEMIYFMKDSISCGNQQFVGIEEHSADKFYHIFPNPADDYIYITSVFKDIEFNLYDPQGRLCLKEIIPDYKKMIDMRKLNNGLYLISVTTPKGTFNSKLIISH